MAAVSKKILLGSIDRARAEKELKERVRDLGEAMSQAVPEGHGYFLVLVDDRGIASFVSGMEREEAVKHLEQVLARLKGA